MDRNRLLVVLQNYHILSLLLILPALFLNEIAGLIFSISGGWFREKLRVWKYFLQPSSWKLLYKKRKERQMHRTSKERSIMKRFTAKIQFQDVNNPIVLYIGNPILSIYWFIVRSLIIW